MLAFCNDIASTLCPNISQNTVSAFFKKSGMYMLSAYCTAYQLSPENLSFSETFSHVGDTWGLI